MSRNLPPRFHTYIARARRRRAIAVALLVTCLLVGTGGAFAQTQLPHQLVATLKPIGSELGIQFAQLPSALSARIPEIDLQLPTGQLAAASETATSFPSYITEKVRNLFCRYLGIGCDATLAEDTSRISNNQLTNIRAQQHATTSQNVKSAPTNTNSAARTASARSATTTSQVVVSKASASASPASSVSPAPQQQVIERTNTVIQTGLTEALLDARLAAFEASIAQRISSMENANATSFRSVSSASNPTSFNASIITGTITNAIDTASAAISSLTATELVATNATTTNLYVSGTATIGSGTGLLQSNTGVVATLANGSNGQVLKVVGGALTWSTDLTGGGGGSSAWATSTDDLALYPADPTDVVLIGAPATTTTGNILEVAGNALFRNSVVSYGSLTAPRFTATSSIASILPYASTTAITATTASTTDLIVSSVPGSLLKTNANGQVAAAVAGTDYLDAATTLFSTTSANYWQTTRNFFSTTSSDYWETQQTARTADDLTNNSIEDLLDVAAITENYGDLFYWDGAAWADIATSSLGISTSNLVEGANLFFTDARVQSFIHSSSTIPKTDAANTFTGLQTFNNASTSILSANTLCLSTDCRTSWPVAGSSFDYLFPANATSTLLGFNGGLTAYASSTIGSGTQAGGLTISGGATTTGTLAVQGAGTSTFASNISISGSIIPTADNTYSLGSASNMWKDVFIGPGSLYVNGKKVLEDVSNVITFSTDANQNLAIQTTGTGNITSQATGSGNHNILTGSGNINVTSSGAGSINISSASGNLNIGTTGSGQLNLGTVTSGTWQGTVIGDSYLTKSGNWTGTFDGLEGSAYLASAFSTTSADAWKDQRNFFATTSADYWKSVTDLFSTTSASYFVSVNQGSLFSTTSADYWGSTRGYATFGYLFPASATSTALTFSGGLLSTASSTFTSNTYFPGGIWNASANVGIGTTSPLYKLSVTQANSAYGIVTSDDTTGVAIGVSADASGVIGTVTNHKLNLRTGGLNRLTIDTSGNVGIGTTSPWGALSVMGLSSTDAVLGPDFVVEGNQNQLSIFNRLSAARSNQLRLTTAGVANWAMGSPDSDAVGDGSEFFISTNTTGANPALWLEPAGNVGIGTTTPPQKLSIYDSASGYTASLLGIQQSGAFSPMPHYAASVQTYGNRSGSNGTQHGLYVQAGFSSLDTEIARFSAIGTSFVDTPRMVVMSSGNVGIGTTTPATILNIAAQYPMFRLTDNDAAGASTVGGRVEFTDASGNLSSVVGPQGSDNVLVLRNVNGGRVDLTSGSTAAVSVSGSNVGIGTTSPLYPFSVQANVADYAAQIFNSGSSFTRKGLLIKGGNFSGAYEVLRGESFDGSNAVELYMANSDLAFRTGATPFERMRITSTGNLGLATTSPWRTLSVVGTAVINGLTSSATGNYVCINTTTWELTRGNGSACTTSSVRFKQDVQELGYGLKDVLSMRPVSFRYKPEMNMGDATRIGFIAEEMQQLVPDVVALDEQGRPSGIDYPSLTAVIANAIKDLATITGQFKANLIAWLGSATNGIQSIFTQKLIAKQVEAVELCLTDTNGTSCYTRFELDAMLSQAAAAATTVSVPSFPPSSSGTPAQNPAQNSTEIEEDSVQNPSTRDDPDIAQNAQTDNPNWTPDQQPETLSPEPQDND